MLTIYTVYVYYSMWSDSDEWDRLYFINKSKAKEYEIELSQKHEELLLNDDNASIIFEEIQVVI